MSHHSAGPQPVLHAAHGDRCSLSSECIARWHTAFVFVPLMRSYAASARSGSFSICLLCHGKLKFAALACTVLLCSPCHTTSIQLSSHQHISLCGYCTHCYISAGHLAQIYAHGPSLSTSRCFHTSSHPVPRPRPRLLHLLWPPKCTPVNLWPNNLAADVYV